MGSPNDNIVVDRAAIARRVQELAAQIAKDFTLIQVSEPGAELTIVPVLTGAFIFAADLIRCLPLKMRIELTTVSSYPGAAVATQGPTLLGQLPDLKNHHILLVEDILDSGQTIQLLREHLVPLTTSLRVVTLLRKQRPEAMATPVDYVGFDIPDEFVVGYGLDHDGYHRNLPDVVSLPTE